MIFIANKGEVEVKIPRTSNKIQETYNILIESQATNQAYTFEDVVDTTSLRDYYTFTLDLSEIPDGEYEYNVSNLCEGLIQIGEISHTISAYTQNNEYKEYGA